MKKVEILKTVASPTPPRPAPSAPMSRPSGSPTTARIAIKPRAAEMSAPVSPDSSHKMMNVSTQFLNQIGEISDTISDLLTTSPNFNVISAIGPQGAGKSTILSMLAGNNSHQMYRDYVFRPVSREANEQSRHQTIHIDIYVTNHQIFLDCQPMHSVSIMETLPKIRGKPDDATAQSDTIRLTAFLLYVSHTVLVVSETHFDKTVIDTIRTAEQIRPYLASFRPKLATDRRTNLVFLKTKASSIDEAPTVIREREQLLRLSFQDSKWLKLSDDAFSLLIVLKEIQMKREHLTEGDEPINEKAINRFDEQIAELRVELQKNREDFTVESKALDEKKWLELCREVIRDQTFHRTLREYQRAHRPYSESIESYRAMNNDTPPFKT